MSDVLYLETDEDITSAVEKLTASASDKVEVVVPKRSTLLQSMINLKLLKKAADQHKKSLVLVTTDRLSSHLAGRVGLPVAEKLGAEASVPETAVKEPDVAAEVIDGGVEETGPPPAAAAAAAGVAAAAAADDADDEMPLPKEESVDDAAKPAEVAPLAAGAAEPVMKRKAIDDKPTKSPATKTARVPDFNALQKRILWVALAAAIILVLVVGNWFLSRATVTIFAKGSNVPVEVAFTADPAATATNIDGSLLKAQDVTSSKDLSEQVPATGQQDVGSKASGTITASNFCYNPGTIASGTTFTAGDGHKFVSTAAVAIPDANISHGSCSATSAQIPVQASANGDSYNLAPTTYSTGNIPSSGASYVKFQGGQMSGGVSKTVTVVQQSDIDKAVADMLSKDKDGGMKDLSTKVNSGYRLINETVAQGQTNVSSDNPVGQQATNVTVKVTATYDGLAVSNSDLSKLFKADVAKQVGPGNQIYDDGTANAQFNVIKKTGTAQQIHSTATASAGPKLDTTAIANQIKGKKYGDANDMLNKMPGVDHAEISLWPGWNTRLPARASKIHITIKVASNSG